MKSTKRLLLIITVSFFIQSNAQISNADSMIYKVFATLQAKDEKAFVALYPNASQFSKMMRTMMEEMMNSEQMKQMMAADEKSKNMNIDSLINTEVDKITKPEAFEEMKKGFAQSFQKTIEKGESKGVNWSNATLTSFTKDTTASMDNEMDILRNAGFKTMKGVIDFSSGGKDYQMSFDKVIYLPSEGGWFGGEFPQLAKKGESLEPDTEMDDSTMALDTTAAVPDKKIKTKTKTKTPTSKTKTKTKTPARKPATKS